MDQEKQQQEMSVCVCVLLDWNAEGKHKGEE